MAGQQKRAWSFRGPSLAVASVLVLASLFALAAPHKALAYYPAPGPDDTYSRAVRYLASTEGAGTQVAPEAFASASDGTLWAVQNADLGPSEIVSYNTGTGSILTVNTVRDFSGPGGTEHNYRTLAGLTFGPDGNLYTCDQNDGLVLQVNPSTGIVTRTIGGLSVFSTPSDLQFDREGDLFVVDFAYRTTDGTDGRVVRYDPTLSTYTAFYGAGQAEGTLNQPHGLCVDAGDNVWVADSYNDRIVEFDNAGAQILSAFRPQTDDGNGGTTDLLQGPQDVYVDEYNTMYVVDQTVVLDGTSTRFVRLAPDGSFLGSYPEQASDGTLLYPSKIAVDSLVYGGDVYVNNNFDADSYGVAGAVERWSFHATVPDNDPPVTTCDAPQGWQHDSVSVSLEATDVGWGVANTYYGFSPSSLTTYTGPVTITAEGTTPFYYRSIDRAGHVETLHEADIQIDHSNPLTTSNIQPIYYGAPSCSLVASDFASGVAATYWRVDNGDWNTGTTPVMPTAFGTHTLDWYSVDNADNAETVHTATFQVLSRAEQDDGRVALVGAWQTVSDSSASGDSYAKTSHSGDRAILTFHGTRLDWFALTGPSWGIAHIKVDGGAGSSVDLYSASPSEQSLVWSSGTVADTTHTVEIDYTGTKNAASSSSAINVDCFDSVGFVGAADADPPVTTDNAPSGWSRPDVLVTLTATDSVSGVDSTYYSTDGSAPTTLYTGPIDFSTEGITTLLYRSVDRVGNIEDTRTATVRLDATPPTTGCTPQPSYASSATILLVPTDALSGVASTRYQLDGGAPATGTVVTTSVVGHHTLAFASTDNVGNAETTHTVSFDVTAQYDDTDPYIYRKGSWTQLPQSGAFGGAISRVDSSGSAAYLNFTGTRVDLLAQTGPWFGIARVYLDGNDMGTVDLYSADTRNNQRVFSLGGLANTTHNVRFAWTGTQNPSALGTAIDLDEADVANALVPDTTKPVTQSNIQDTWVQQPFVLTLTPSDQGSWPAATYVTVNGTTSLYTGPVSITQDGTSTVSYWSVDGAGNVENPITTTVRVDAVAPNSTDDVPAGWVRAPFLVSLSSSDAESGIQMIFAIVNNGGQFHYQAPFLVSNEGTTPIIYWAMDGAGNVENQKTAYVQIDTQAPSTTDNASSVWTSGSVDVSLTATDVTSGISQTLYGLNGAPLTTPTSGPIHVTAEGTTTIRYHSVDLAGNVETTHTTSVRIDNSAPVTAASVSESYAGTATVPLTPTDSLSGVAQTYWRIDSGAWTTGTVATLPFAGGSHSLQWYSVDNAGNAETVQSASYQMMARYEQSDPSIYFPTPWTTDLNPLYSGGSAMLVGSPGATMTLAFTGTQFGLVAPTGPNFGIGRLIVDGVPTMVDEYSASQTYGNWVYLNTSLANTSHFVQFGWTGTKNAASGGTTIGMDAVDVLGNLNGDTTPPQTTSNIDSAWRNTTETVTFSATDAGSYVAATYYRINSGAVNTYTAPLAVGAEGTSTIDFWSVDGAGNVETTHTAMVRIDRTAPASTSDAPAGWVHGPATIHLSATDAGVGGVTTYYSLDGSTPTLVATSAITISAEGTTTLKFRSADSLANTETVRSVQVRIDNTAPSTTNNASGSWVKAPATVTLTPTDALSGVATTYYSLDGSNPSLVCTGPITISADGTTTLKYYSRDNVGNVEATKSVSVKVDAVAPVTTSNAGTEYLNTASITLTRSDAESGIAATYWSIDGSAWTSGTVAATSTVGSHELDWYSVDNAGNTEAVKSADFDIYTRVDATTSNAKFAWGLSSRWYTQSSGSYYGSSERYTSYSGAYVQFVFNGTGFHIVATKASGYGTATVLVDGTNSYQVGFNNSTTLYQQRVFNLTGLDNTQHTVRITCNSGNKQIRLDALDVVGTLSTQVDVTPPTTTDNTDGLWHQGSFGLVLSASDSLSGVATTTYSINGGAWQSYTNTVTVSTEGTNNVQYYSIDTQNNVEPTNTCQVLVDASPPVSSCDATSSWITTGTTVHLSSSDAYSGLAGIRYSVNGSAASTYTTGIGVSAEGTTTIAYAGVDNVGNVETTKTANVRIDRTAPVTTSDAAASYPNTATVNLTVSDSGSGVARTMWSLDGSAWTSGTVASTTATGTHTLQWYSVDAAGNQEATKSAGFTVVSRFEQDDPHFLMQGTWTTLFDANAYSAGTLVRANTAGSVFYLSFKGTALDLISYRNPYWGIMQVSLDGQAPVDVDLYDSGYKTKTKVWSVSGLTDATHTVSVAWTGRKNPLAVGTDVAVDAVDVTGYVVSDVVPPSTTSTIDSTWRATPETVSLSASDTGSWVKNSYYKIGSTTTTYTAPFVVSAEGTTNVAYWSVDAAGNVETTRTGTVRIDTTPPSSSDDATSAWRSGPLTVHIGATDSGSGVSTSTYSLDGSDPTLTYPAGGITVSAEGTTTLKYRSSDVVGNLESVNSRTLRVDNTAPVTTDNAPAGWVAGPVSVTLTPSDALSGVSTTMVSVNGAPATPYSSAVAVTAEGTTTIQYASTDAAGNTEATKTAFAHIDRTPPTTTDDAPAGWVGGPVLVTLTASDTVSGVSATYYSVDGSTPTVPYTAPIVVSAQGLTNVRYYSVDREGNAEAVRSASVRIDDNAPTTSDNAPTGWSRTPVQVTLTATDSASGVSGTWYSTNGSFPNLPYSSPLTISAEGTTALRYYSADVKGNAEAVHTAYVKIDYTAPSTGSNVQSSYGNTATITLTPNDALSGVAATYYSLDNSAPTTGTVITTTAPGHHTASWWSIDGAGNQEGTNTVSFDLFNRVDDLDSHILYTGTWGTESNPQMYLGAEHTANATAAAYFTFTGTGVSLIGARGPDYGIGSVSIDGTNAVDVDFYSSVVPPQQHVFTVSNLATGTHSISVAWTGRKNASSSGSRIALDSFDLTGASATDTSAPVTTPSVGSAWRNTSANLALTAFDSGTYVASTYYKLGAGSVTTYTAPIAISSEGTTQVSYWSVDALGNVETTKTSSIRIDKTAPVTTDDAPAGWQGHSVTVHLSPTDPLSGVAATSYRVNGSAAASYTPDGIQVSADGTTTITYFSSDVAGNSESTKTATVRVDTTPPQTSSDATGTYLTDATIQLSATDAASGVSSTTYQLDGSSWTSGTVVTTSTAGTHTLAFRSTDAVGNVEPSHSVTFTILPQSAATRFEQTDSRLLWTGTWTDSFNAGHSGASAKWINAAGSVKLQFTGTAINWIGVKASSYGRAKVTLDGSTTMYADSYASSTLYAQKVWGIAGLPNRSHTLLIEWTGTKNAASSGTYVGVDAFDVIQSLATVDTTAPVTTLTPGSAWRTADTTVSITATDSSGVDATYYRVNGGAWNVYSGPWLVSAEGTTTVDFYSVDQVRNVETTKTATIRVDKTAPATTDNHDANWHAGSFNLTLTAVDAVSGVASTQYSVNGSAVATYTGPISLTQAGANVVQYFSTDFAGNAEQTRTATVTVDPAPPVTTSNITSGWSRAPVTVSLTATDTNSGVAATYYSVGAGLPTLYTGPFIVAGDGQTQVQYWSQDVAGNVESTHTQTVSVDSAAPVTTDNSDTAWHRGSFALTLSATDTVSGVAATNYSLNGSALTSYTPAGILVNANGVNTISYASIDAAGNVEATKTITVKIDSKAPSTSSDVTTSYLLSATIHLSATDGETSVSDTSYRLDGGSWTSGTTVSTAATGTHTLDFRSTDMVGNVEPTQTVTFTVQPQSATTRYEQTDSRLVWGGTWTDTFNAGHSGASAKWVNATGSVKLQFSGTAINWIGVKASAYGIARVTVDTGTPTYASCYAPSTTYQQKIWGANGLPNRSHTVLIEWTNTKEASSTGTYVGVDAFDVLGSLTAVDTTGPVTTLSPSNAWSKSDISASLSATDPSGVDFTYYRVNGGTWSRYMAPWPVTATGTTTVDYYSVDQVGNVETTKTAYLRIDRTPPSTTDNASSGWHQGSFSLSLSGSDDLSGVASTRYSLDGAALATYSGPVSITKPGTTTVSYFSVDAAGNTEATKTATVAVDPLPPVTSSSATDAWVNTTQTVSVTATDTQSGVGLTFAWLGTSQPAVYTGALTIGSEGVTPLHYYSVDGVGNVEATNTSSVRIDRTAPVTTCGVSPVVAAGATLSINATDALSGVACTWARVDSSAWSTTSPVAPSTSGTHTVMFYSIDNAGNAESTHTVTFSVDASAPVSTSNAPNGWINHGTVVSLTATDSQSAVAATMYSLAGSAFTTYTAPLSIDGTGPVALQFYSVDAVGNREATRSASINIDKTAPVTSSDATSAYLASAVINLQPTDTQSGVAATHFSLDGAALTSGTVVATSVIGTHTVTWSSIDAVGNQETTESATFCVLSNALATRFEQTDSHLLYQGTWTDSTNANHSAGTAKWASDASSTVNISFTGTAINWIGVKAASYGKADVILDGGDPVTVDLYSSTTAYQQKLWGAAGLSNGPHTIQIWSTGTRNPLAGGTYVGVDAFDVVGALTTATPMPTRRYEQTDTHLVYQGSWTDSINPSHSAGSAKWTNTKGSSIDITFKGTQFTWIGVKAPSYGQAKVTLDDGIPVVVSEYASQTAYAQALWTTGALPYGAHAIRIEWTDTKETSSTGTYVGFDAADVLGVITQAVPTSTKLFRMEETDPRLVWTGTWTVSSNVNHSGTTARWANSSGSAVYMSFSGTSVDLYGVKAASYGIMKVTLDLNAPVYIDLYSATTLYQQKLFSSGTLPDGTHKLRIEYTGTKNPLSSNSYVGVDCFDVMGTPLQASSAGPTLIRYEETDAHILKTGSWTTSWNANLSGSSAVWSATNGDTVKVAFSGTSVTWYGVTASSYGTATVSIDGGAPVTVSCYSANTLYQQSLFSATGLAEGPHTMTITVSGNKPVGFDCVDVFGEIMQAQ